MAVQRQQSSDTSERLTPSRAQINPRIKTIIMVWSGSMRGGFPVIGPVKKEEPTKSA